MPNLKVLCILQDDTYANLNNFSVVYFLNINDADQLKDQYNRGELPITALHVHKDKIKNKVFKRTISKEGNDLEVVEVELEKNANCVVYKHKIKKEGEPTTLKILFSGTVQELIPGDYTLDALKLTNVEEYTMIFTSTTPPCMVPVIIET